MSDENETHPFRWVGLEEILFAPYPHASGHMQQQHMTQALEGLNMSLE
jgi:hypothetical protein